MIPFLAGALLWHALCVFQRPPFQEAIAACVSVTFLAGAMARRGCDEVLVMILIFLSIAASYWVPPTHLLYYSVACGLLLAKGLTFFKQSPT